MTPATAQTMMSSKKQDWGTPQAFFDGLSSQFNFTLDVCATAENAKCREYISPEIDAFKFDWGLAAGPGACWMNPPYGRELTRWIMEAAQQSWGNGARVVALVPARPDTKWFGYAWARASRVYFVRGRLRFEGAPAPAPFPSAVFVFDGRKAAAGLTPKFLNTKGEPLEP